MGGVRDLEKNHSASLTMVILFRSHLILIINVSSVLY